MINPVWVFLVEAEGAGSGNKDPIIFSDEKGPHFLNLVKPQEAHGNPRGAWSKVSRILTCLVSTLKPYGRKEACLHWKTDS